MMVLGIKQVDPAGRARLEAAYAHSPGALTIAEEFDPKAVFERLAAPAAK
jgi:hypothetical protein